MLVDWATLKSVVDARSLSIQYVLVSDTYWIKAFDGPFSLETTIHKKTTPDVGGDQEDFEDNYISTSNKTYTDGDGSSLLRTKMATAGWTYQARFIEFETSKLSSVKNEMDDGTDYADATIKFYNASDVELTDQPTIDTDCVKTVFCFEPVYDMEVIGGSTTASPTPTNDVYLWLIGVPDVPANLGGSKVMINQLNLKINPTFEVDGRTPKRMNYDATYHTSKLCSVIKHNAGDQCKIMMEVEHFKL